jgi:hypothetical protein
MTQFQGVVMRFAQNALVALCCASSAVAGTHTILTSHNEIDGAHWNQGWFKLSGNNTNVSNVSIFLGSSNSGGSPGEHRNYFTFFLPSMAPGETVVEATLLWINAGNSSTNEATETLEFFDVTTDATTLNNTLFSSAIYTDLGTGTSYGQHVVPGFSDSTDEIQFPLNLAAIAKISASAGSYFSIGGRLLTGDGDDFLFAGRTGPATLRLVTVPEPPGAATSLVFAMVAAAIFRGASRGNK